MQFLISPKTSTVPVVVDTMLRTGLSPTSNALSVVLVVVWSSSPWAAGASQRHEFGLLNAQRNFSRRYFD